MQPRSEASSGVEVCCSHKVVAVGRYSTPVTIARLSNTGVKVLFTVSNLSNKERAEHFRKNMLYTRSTLFPAKARR